MDLLNIEIRGLNNYKGLATIGTDVTEGLTPTLKALGDGVGGYSPLQLSETNVAITGGGAFLVGDFQFTPNYAMGGYAQWSSTTTSIYHEWALSSNTDRYLFGLEPSGVGFVMYHSTATSGYIASFGTSVIDFNKNLLIGNYGGAASARLTVKGGGGGANIQSWINSTNNTYQYITDGGILFSQYYQTAAGGYYRFLNRGWLDASADGAFRLMNDSGAAGSLTVSNVTGTGYFSLTAQQRIEIGTAPNRTLLTPTGPGILRLSDANENDFNRLQFGGTDATYPSLKRNGTAIDVKLANDSGYAGLTAGSLVSLGGIQAYSTIEGYSTGQAASLSGAVKVGSGGNNNASAILQADSTTKGFLGPRMTTVQINAISTPATGLEVYNTDLGQPCFYDGASWKKVTHSAM